MREGKLNDIDKKVYQNMNIKEPMITFFKIFTNLASTIFFIIVCILLIVLLKNKLALLISILMLFDSVLIYTFKHIMKRERPNIRQLVNEKGYSFPSGHTVSAVCFYGFFIVILGASSIFVPLKIVIIISLILFLLLIGYSRIFLGVHYFSDVIGGYLLGISFVLLFVYLIERFTNLI